MTDPITIKVKDAAATIGCSARTVIRLIDSGKLRAVKLTGEHGPYFVFLESIHLLLGHQSSEKKASHSQLQKEASAVMARLGIRPLPEPDDLVPGRKSR